MKQTIDRILRYYGTAVTLEDGAPDVKAFLRPVTAKSWQNMQRVMDQLGEVQQGQYLFIGPADRPVAVGTEIVSKGQHYVVRKAEILEIGQDALYCWALLVRGGETDATGS